MASNEYQPIAEKHEQQEKAVSEFVRSGQVIVYLMSSVFVLEGCVCNTPLLIKGCCVHIQFVYISLLYSTSQRSFMT